jgi:hypothetical protein
MATNTPSDDQGIPDSVAQNAGARTTATNNDPSISLKEGENAAAGEGPNASGGSAPSTVEEHIPSTSSPESTDIPTANVPNPEAFEADIAEKRS